MQETRNFKSYLNPNVCDGLFKTSLYWECTHQSKIPKVTALSLATCPHHHQLLHPTNGSFMSANSSYTMLRALLLLPLIGGHFSFQTDNPLNSP